MLRRPVMIPVAVADAAAAISGGAYAATQAGDDSLALLDRVNAAVKARRLTQAQADAQIARAQGKSVSGLEQAISSSVKSRLDRAVAAGRLTKDQEQQRLDRLNQFCSDIVNRTPPAGAPVRPGWARPGWGGPGGYGGPASDGAPPGDPGADPGPPPAA